MLGKITLFSRLPYYRPASTLGVVVKHSKSLVRGVSSVDDDTNRTHLITTPIFYVNDVPHIGHLHTAVKSDAVSRWQRMKGRNVFFSTGTDEHGLKIQKSAKAAGVSPKSHCDKISAQFRQLFSLANIQYSEFVRTTEDRHIDSVQHFWRQISNAGHIYKGSYAGWYCVSDEAFLTENDIVEKPSKNGEVEKVSKDSGHHVEWLEEDNYMFRLPRFKDDLLHWLRNPVIKPTKFHNNVLRMVEETDTDLSISRSRSRLNWGIEVPDDDSQTIYVWLDALVNYLTVSGYPKPGYTWPADCHVVGKDILKFHAVYWPAFLMAAGLDPPREILCHSHWLVEGVKMSKSLGNVVDPFSCINDYTVDGMRYFLLREAVPHSDANFTTKKVLNIVNSELANTLGNLLQRSTSKIVNPLQEFPRFNDHLFHQTATDEQKQMWQELRTLPQIVDEHFSEYNFYKGIEAIMTQLHHTNVFFDKLKPWELCKQDDQRQLLENTLHVTMETLRIVAILLQPIVPGIADRILNQLNMAKKSRTYGDSLVDYEGGIKLDQTFSDPVFRRLKQK